MPQCFLDQPLNQILHNNGASATNANHQYDPRDQLGSKLESRGGSILSASNQNKKNIGELQPPHLTGNNFGSTLGTSIGKVPPISIQSQLRDKNASTKMEEPRSLPAGELDIRHDEMNQIGQVLKMHSKYKPTEAVFNLNTEQWEP